MSDVNERDIYSREPTIHTYQIESRRDLNGKAKLLLAGGTILSHLGEGGTRVGGISVPDMSDYLTNAFPDYSNTIEQEETVIYEGLSEDVSERIIQEMTERTVQVINGSRHNDSFIMFLGSDMAEVIGSRLDNAIGSQLGDQEITLDLVYANEPLPHASANMQCMRALEAVKNKKAEKRNGGMHLISEKKVIPVKLAKKKTWDGEMGFYDVSGKQDMDDEERRRMNVFSTTDSLARLFFKRSVTDLLETGTYFDQKVFRTIKRQTYGKQDSVSHATGSDVDSQRQSALWDLATEPFYHPVDPSGRILIRNINTLADIPTYEEFQDAQAVLFILNHSATTRMETATAMRNICQRRIEEGNPLAAFAVTETGEPRTWNPQDGIYPSANILNSHVVLLPTHIKPAMVKLWAGLYSDSDYSLAPGDRKAGPALIDFMLHNFDGEVLRQPFTSDIQNVKRVVFGN